MNAFQSRASVAMSSLVISTLAGVDVALAVCWVGGVAATATYTHPSTPPNTHTITHSLTKVQSVCVGGGHGVVAATANYTGTLTYKNTECVGRDRWGGEKTYLSPRTPRTGHGIKLPLPTHPVFL